ncbi:hypothetical protein RJ641_014042 [Dillenia turbinata]|uniref:Uncharacterized protein n=1 Tax=Dillenia turbinata TaxID=194707 RepID=A0AAN8WHC2_9MAGN
MEAKSKKKVYEAKKFRVCEEDGRLIGKIVEKGTLSGPITSSAPKPLVVPFPVARHRSHGPGKGTNLKLNAFVETLCDIRVQCIRLLWVVMWGWSGTHDDNDDDEDEGDEDYVNCDPVAVFANSIERKKARAAGFVDGER